MNPSVGEHEELFNRLVDGLAGPEDEHRLSELLRSSADARRAYREFMALHSALHWDYVATALPECRPSLGESGEVLAERNTTLGETSLRIRSALAAFLAGIVVATVAAWMVLRPMGSTNGDHRDVRSTDVKQVVGGGENGVRTNDAEAKEPPRKDALAALLVDEVGSQFAERRAPDGVRFGQGEYELTAGIIHLRFAQGADVIVTSPARFDVKDSQRIRLAHGKIRVTAPPSAKGFTVATREVDYVDLGTEFGLRVDSQNGASDLYVFDGQVNVADPQSGKVLSEVVEGESSRSIDGVIAEAPHLTGSEFPTSGAIGQQRWQRYAEQLRESEGLLAFYPFLKTDDETTLTNRKEGGAAGKIVGARWVSGRWPGKEALLFDRDTDFAEIEIPGEHRELTMATWINVDRLDYELNAIVNSDGNDVGEVHFQLTRLGLPRGGVIVEGSFQDHVVGNSVPFGQWTHVAMVASNDSRTSRLYINGTLARQRQYPREETLRPGQCRIGNWLAHSNSSMANRALRGRMDELAIWNRALSELEIQKLVEVGRPGLLWNVD